MLFKKFGALSLDSNNALLAYIVEALSSSDKVSHAPDIPAYIISTVMKSRIIRFETGLTLVDLDEVTGTIGNNLE